MPLFEHFFNKKQLPVDDERSSGSSLSFELPHKLEVGQTWISKDSETRINIESLDPVMARKYGNERGLPEYKNVDALKKELWENGYTLQLGKKKKPKVEKKDGVSHDPAITFFDVPRDTTEENGASGDVAEDSPSQGEVSAAVKMGMPTDNAEDGSSGAAADDQKDVESGENEDLSWRKELDDFLSRPEGREKITNLKDVIVEEWKIFDEGIYKAALDKKTHISRGERKKLWRTTFLPQLKIMSIEYLELQSVPRREAGRIFRAVIFELEKESENNA